jgi:hypothetical protein
MGASGGLQGLRGRCISVGVRAVRWAPWVARLAAVVVLAARPLPAQDTTAVLRGVVMDTAGTRVPYALVRILPTRTERFTDVRGAFVFTALPLGAYRIQARQVGYEPFESAVSLRAEGAALRIALRPLTILLDELTVTVPGRCTAPGPPDPATSPELALIFAELRENARRFAVLADSYPFLYYIERTFTDLGENGAVLWSAADTVEYRSDSRVRYRPGDIIAWGPGLAGRRGRVVRLPSLPDLADSTFHANHCFAFGGVLEHDGRWLLRIAFRAADRLRTPDIDGEAYLDPDTYQLRYLSIRLTRPERATPRLVSASIAMTPLELYRNVLVPGTVRGATVPPLIFTAYPEDRRTTKRTTKYVEVQRLFRVHFLRPLPVDSTPSPQPSP